MRLSALPIINWNGINNFCTGNQWTIRAGDPNTLYFQLIDLDQKSCNGGCPSRYIAGVGIGNQPASVLVTFRSIDCINVIQVTATQDPNDASVWSINLAPSQRPFGGAVKFSVTEGTQTRNFSVINMLCVEGINAGSDGALADYGTFDYNPGWDSGV